MYCEFDTCYECIGTAYRIETDGACEHGYCIHTFCSDKCLSKWLYNHFWNYEREHILNETNDPDEAQKRLQVYCERLCDFNKEHTNTIKKVFKEYMEKEFDPDYYSETNLKIFQKSI